jgi:hypothetical protein
MLPLFFYYCYNYIFSVYKASAMDDDIEDLEEQSHGKLIEIIQHLRQELINCQNNSRLSEVQLQVSRNKRDLATFNR